MLLTFRDADGGGVRGLSTIIILYEIMKRVNHGRRPSEELHPWQVFDMIGGTSTGGYVAVPMIQVFLSD